MNRTIFNFYLMVFLVCVIHYAYKQGIVMGYVTRQLEEDKNLYAIKKRTVAKDNILQYPFRDKSRQTEKAGDSDSVHQSGIVKETE